MLTVLGHRLNLKTGKELPVVMARVSVGVGPEKNAYYLLIELDKLTRVTVQVEDPGVFNLAQHPINLPVVVEHFQGMLPSLRIVEVANHENVLDQHGPRRGAFYTVTRQLFATV